MGQIAGQDATSPNAGPIKELEGVLAARRDQTDTFPVIPKDTIIVIAVWKIDAHRS
jgi:hypothetical protein